MGLHEATITPLVADTDGIADDWNIRLNVPVVMDGVLCSGGIFTSVSPTGQQLTLTETEGNGLSGITFTIVGTAPNGDAQTSIISGPTALATVATTEYYVTITSITYSRVLGEGALPIDVGAGAGNPPPYPLNWRADDSATVAIMGSQGTFQVDIEETFDNVIANGFGTANWIVKHANKTGDFVGELSPQATGVRTVFDSSDGSTTFQFHVNQLEYKVDHEG